MLRLRVFAIFAGLLALALGWCGCIPDDRHVDEEKDPHFQRGISLVNSQDYKGAVAEFERALENNPHSAAAHFELGCLYDTNYNTKINDSAAAIYHYERYLQLLPNSERAQMIRERIRGCKQDLANTEFPLPDSQHLQREVDRLTAENLALKQQLAALQRQQAAGAALAQARPEPPPARPDPARMAARVPSLADSPTPAHARVHIVRERETIRSIAAKYHLKASAILAANPRVDPRRLRIGQSLNLP